MEITKFTVVATGFLILLWINVGLYLEIFGPTMIDLTILYHTSYESIGRSLSGRGVGGLVGALLSGLITDRWEHWLDLITALGNCLAAVVILLVPFSTDTNILLTICILLGVAISTVNVAGQRLLILMWQEEASAPAFALHMGFGIGALLIPVFTNPFLAVLKYDDGNQNPSDVTTTRVPVNCSSTISGALTSTAMTVTNHFQRSFTIERESKIQYIYGTISAVTFAMCVVFFIIQCVRHKNGTINYEYNLVTNVSTKSRGTRSWRERINPATYTGGSTRYGTVIFILLFIYYFNVVGAEQMFGTFVRSFSVDLLHFTRDKASYLNMVFWLGFTGGRLAGTIAAIFIHIKWLILVEIVANMASVIALNLFATRTPVMLWVFTGVQGFVSAPLYPSGIAFANTVMDVSGVCLMVIMMSGGLGDFAYLWLAGKVYDTYGPAAILYAMLIAAILAMVVVIVLRVITRSQFKQNVNHYRSNDVKLSALAGQIRDEEDAPLMTSEDEL